MLEFKQKAERPFQAERPPRAGLAPLNPQQQPAPQQVRPLAMDIGIDRRRVTAFVILALIAGFALGFGFARYGTKKAANGLLTRGDQSHTSNGGTIATVPAVSPTEFHRVTGVIRGDVIKVEGIGPVRMLGIETPDGKEPKSIFGVHGQAAINYVKQSLLGKEVRLEYDPSMAQTGNKDSAGNTLAYVYTRDGTLFNGEMIKLGHAFVVSSVSFGKIDLFRSLEQEAMESMRGVWGPSGPQTMNASAGTEAAGGERNSGGVKSKKLLPVPPPRLESKSDAFAGSPSDPLVWVSSDDKMYHKSGCPYLSRDKHQIPLSEAKAEGYVACGRCFASTVMKAQ